MHSEENDDIFRSAYEEVEQQPSGDAWQKMSARLDSKHIASYKKRLLVWRSAAMLLFLLLVGFILFEQSSLINHEQKQIVSSKTKQFIEPEKKSIGLQKAFSIEKASQTGDRMARDYAREGIPRIADPLFNIAPDATSINLNQEPSSSIILSHSLPLPNRLSMSIASLPAPQDSIGQYITMPNSLNRPSPWSFTGFVTYERANYRLDNDLPPSSEKSLIQQREEHEASFSTGILVNHQIKSRWSIQTGLIYSNTSIGIKPQIMYASHDDQGNIAFKYVTSSGYAYVKAGFRPGPSVGDSLTTAVAQHNLQSVSVPISIRYHITNRRLLLQPGVGVAVNFFTSTKVKTEIKDASHRESVIINKLDGTRPLYFSLITDANIQYGLNNRWSLNFTPTFKYALTSITKDHVVQTFPYSFGIGVGATHRF